MYALKKVRKEWDRWSWLISPWRRRIAPSTKWEYSHPFARPCCCNIEKPFSRRRGKFYASWWSGQVKIALFSWGRPPKTNKIAAIKLHRIFLRIRDLEGSSPNSAMPPSPPQKRDTSPRPQDRQHLPFRPHLQNRRPECLKDPRLAINGLYPNWYTLLR